jgi:hypothetical protein
VAPWTFETLAEADRQSLEEVMLSGSPPDFEQLEGYSYRGWNQQRIARVSGEKFKKAFRSKDGRRLGYNEVVRQDGKRWRGEWEVKTKDGRPIQIGYFEVSPANNSVLFDYNVELNTGRNFPLRVIRDFAVLPNPGDHDVLLGKAYLQLGLRVFYSYFVLGHRQQIAHEPW